jgi:chromosome partitioning protein
MPGPAPRRTVALINQKGGVGKTTTTVNLAAAIAGMGRSVLVIDLDPQAHATLYLGIDPDEHAGSIYDLLQEPDTDPASVIVKARENLSLIPSETDLAAVESELAGAPDRQTRLRRCLSHLAGDYEFILLDCPPSLGLLTLNALAAAEEVVIPMQAHFLSLQGVGKLLETVDLVTGSLNPDLRVSGIILNMFDQQATHTQEVVADLEQFFKQAQESDKPWRHGRLYQPPVRRNIKLAESPSFGQTIFDYAPTAAGARDYWRLAEQFIDEWDRRLGRPPRAPGPAEQPPPANQPDSQDTPDESPEPDSAPQVRIVGRDGQVDQPAHGHG